MIPWLRQSRGFKRMLSEVELLVRNAPQAQQVRRVIEDLRASMVKVKRSWLPLRTSQLEGFRASLAMLHTLAREVDVLLADAGAIATKVQALTAIDGTCMTDALRA